MKILRAVLAITLAVAVFWGLNGRHGLFPPLGKLLNPFAGFWRNGSREDKPPASLTLPGLRDTVDIIWDARHVPHIFARNDHDLYFAQGYVVARDRLWQMEFQALYAAGRLSEVVGPALVQQDRLQRRLGLVWSAEKMARAFQDDSLISEAVGAYRDGVNAYLHSLSPQDYPVEYKILDYAPEPWTELKTALLMKSVAWTLSGMNQDLVMTRTRAILGQAFVDSLFPDLPPYLEPVIPRGTAWDFRPVPVPQPLAAAAASPGQNEAGPGERPQGPGSNNWAVSGKMTRSGFPILCNDPHLDLTLPSVWYEVQLAAPGVNVYGVTFTGAPGVVIGFNGRAAWGVTAALSDVLDWYEVKFKDKDRREYLYDGKWRPVEVREDKIKVKGGTTSIDRVLYTHHGPVVCLEDEKPLAGWVPRGAALRWAPHDVSNELLSLYRLNRASHYQDFLEAMKSFSFPALNFVYADARGDIALWHSGRFPLRWKGQGRYILDGSKPADEWMGWIPWDHNPHVKNPERGFLSSANQQPVDETYPYYLGWEYGPFERGRRINESLSAGKDFAPEDMIRVQTDNLNLRARLLLPRLLPVLRQVEPAAEERTCLEALEKWDCQERADSAAPLIFNFLWDALNEKTWNDELKPGMDVLYWPLSNVFLDLALNHPDSSFFDDKKTPAVEVFADIALSAFKTACRRLAEKYGRFGRAWQWGRARGTDIRHLGSLPGFGRDRLFTPGDTCTINAIGRTHGPSWRMVVALGPEVKAWGIYPGGESGNPGSRYYDNGVGDWLAGRTYELLFMSSAGQAVPGRTSKTELRGEK